MKARFLVIHPSPALANRYMGYPCVAARSPGINRRFESLWLEALSLIEPRGSFRILPATGGRDLSFPGQADALGIGLCTLGPGLEARIQERTVQGDLVAALILDAIGSAAAEAAADSLEETVAARGSARGLHGLERWSPGYGGWPVRHQVELFERMSPANLGVRLTDHQMMIPRKSVSFVVPFSREAPARARRRDRCARCSLASCAYRRGPSPEKEIAGPDELESCA